MRFLKKIFGSRNDRVIKNYYKVVNQINKMEKAVSSLSDEDLAAKTTYFKKCLNEGKSMQQILPQAFAVVREVAKRTLGMRHFDVQLIGGMTLFDGKVAEMKTGEGKTLASTLPVYLSALSGRGVHVVTVNDYLAKRDAEWMRPIYDFLGMSVGVIGSGVEPEERKNAYACDVTYGTNNEFGFDYLRDNMALELENKVQRDLSYAIVDELDSILIDEARTPLIISGADDKSNDLHEIMNKIASKLVCEKEEGDGGDFSLDEKNKQIYLTESGHANIEKIMLKHNLLQPGESLYEAKNIALLHYLYAALKAHSLFKVDIDYIVKDNKIVIVDEHTGRTMPGRRWSDGIHQAVEAKEGVPIENENQTLASITFQNFFRLYDNLAGMTGTADTEAYELNQIYGLETVVIPSNKPNRRIDGVDIIYKTSEEKFAAIVDTIKSASKQGQPILVGTASIEVSEYVSSLLRKENISHNVLNAKHHDREADIIADAGLPGAITIATNMAGRGTDIVLGGRFVADDEEWKIRNEQVIKAGGLFVIGTERHESRRIDNQLRGRAARQGDVGKTQFFLSLEDSLMRIFISETIARILGKLGLKHGEAITHSMVSKAVENAQRRVEGYNFDVRKQLLEFDDVANEQRKVIYQQRNKILESTNIDDIVKDMVRSFSQDLVDTYMPLDKSPNEWDLSSFDKHLNSELNLQFDIASWVEKRENIISEEVIDKLCEEFNLVLDAKRDLLKADNFFKVQKYLLLSAIDNQWREHLSAMEYLRQGMHLRGYAQKDPKQEYKREAFELFAAMLENVKREVILKLMVLRFEVESDDENLNHLSSSEPQNLNYKHSDFSAANGSEEDKKENLSNVASKKIPRNSACYCGSGKKYKHCHGSFVSS